MICVMASTKPILTASSACSSTAERRAISKAARLVKVTQAKVPIDLCIDIQVTWCFLFCFTKVPRYQANSKFKGVSGSETTFVLPPLPTATSLAASRSARQCFAQMEVLRVYGTAMINIISHIKPTANNFSALPSCGAVKGMSTQAVRVI
jgi:hypothetical protein